jgi:hypothetical protein
MCYETGHEHDVAPHTKMTRATLRKLSRNKCKEVIASIKEFHPAHRQFKCGEIKAVRRAILGNRGDRFF